MSRAFGEANAHFHSMMQVCWSERFRFTRVCQWYQSKFRINTNQYADIEQWTVNTKSVISYFQRNPQHVDVQYVLAHTYPLTSLCANSLKSLFKLNYTPRGIHYYTQKICCKYFKFGFHLLGYFSSFGWKFANFVLKSINLQINILPNPIGHHTRREFNKVWKEHLPFSFLVGNSL